MRVTLNGIVSADEDVKIYEWFGYKAFSPQTVRDALANNPDGEELVLELNSPGGSVFAGSEMYSVLKSAEHIQTRAEIQSLAASAASYLCLGCDQVWISPVAQMMIHLATTCTEGDRDDHLRSVQLLDSTREAILNAYELKAGVKANRTGFRQMMEATTWLTAQAALEKGLVDGILYQEEPVPQNVMNFVGQGIRALGETGGVPNIAHLRAEYARAQQQPKAPAENPESIASTGGAPEAHTQDWRVQARLDLEKIRF